MMPDSGQSTGFVMSNPLSNYELPELPLGTSLRDHMASYLVNVIGAIRQAKEMNPDGDFDALIAVERTLSQVYEDISGILEFNSREEELLRGSDRIRVSANRALDTAYITVIRDGEPVFEFPFGKAGFGEFLKVMQDAFETMRD